MKADPRGVLTDTHFIDGDHACCEGALAAGARFAAGYPITPSTEVMERFAARVPTVRGTFIQMEDELAASITLQGAVWGGAKAFTVTSGPGFSLTWVTRASEGRTRLFRLVPERYQEDCALALGMRRKEVHDIIVIEGEAGGAKVLRVGGEVELASEDAGLKLHRAIAAISKPGDDLMEIGQKEHVDASISRKFLLQSQVPGLAAEVAFLQKFKSFFFADVEIRARNEVIDAVHDQVQVTQSRAQRVQEIRRDPARGPVERRRKLSK